MALKKNAVLAVILGGGAGSRLYPLTAARSKPAVPVAGKYRLVDIPISNCINSGISRMMVLTQFNSVSLNRHIKNTYHFGEFHSGFVDILAAEQTPDNVAWFRGTADAVRQTLHHITAYEYDYILLLSGDQLYHMNFEKLLENHIAENADMSIATIPVHERDATGLGIMKVDAQKIITSFIEKPKSEELQEWTSDTGATMQANGRNYLASMGIYVFNREVLRSVLFDKHPTGIDFGKEIIPNVIATHKVSSYQFEGYWTDIGTIHSFFEANIELTREIPQFNMFDEFNPIYTHSRLLPPAKMAGVFLDKAIISDGCIINAKRISTSVIGMRSRIGFDTVIEETYMMGGDRYETLEALKLAEQQNVPKIGVGDRCHIKKTIIDKDARIGNDVRINVTGQHLANTDHDLYCVREGIVVIKKQAVVPNGFVI